MTLSDHIIALLGQGPKTIADLIIDTRAHPIDLANMLVSLEVSRRISHQLIDGISVWSIGGPGKAAPHV